MGSSLFLMIIESVSIGEYMDIRKLESSELQKLIDTPDMPESLVIEALDELYMREQDRIYQEEIADMIIYFKNP